MRVKLVQFCTLFHLKLLFAVGQRCNAETKNRWAFDFLSICWRAEDNVKWTTQGAIFECQIHAELYYWHRRRKCYTFDALKCCERVKECRVRGFSLCAHQYQGLFCNDYVNLNIFITLYLLTLNLRFFFSFSLQKLEQLS